MDLVSVQSVRMARTRADLALGTPLGGGTWLYSEPQPGTTELVDLTGLGWHGVTRSAEHLTVGATCPIADVRELDDSPLFQQCADSLLASWKIQRIATIGGNLAMALPAGAMVALAVGLDARLLLCTADGERTLPAADFVTGVRSTVLRPGEVIRAVEFPLPSPRTAFRRIALSPLGRTGTLVTGRRDVAGQIHLAITGGTTRPRTLLATDFDAAIENIDDWYDDPHGSPDWRRAMSHRFALEIIEELA
jgi:CO/xanthine dehydrogenase FAD-binding subunit